MNTTSRRILQRIVGVCDSFGINPRRSVTGVLHVPRYVADIVRYARRNRGRASFPLRARHLYPYLADYSDASGVAKGHYFHQDLYAARKIFEARPQRHVDIGSRIDGFIAHVLCFMPVECIDIRALDSRIPGLSFTQSDATELTGIADDSVPSLSSLHAAEHFGLGRYGDPIDPGACLRFMRSLARVLAPGGRLYFSVPVGHERLEFNAQRVFAPSTVLDTFSDLRLVSFAAVLDDGELYPDIALEKAASAYFACGIFEFTK